MAEHEQASLFSDAEKVLRKIKSSVRLGWMIYEFTVDDKIKAQLHYQASSPNVRNS
jgi:hypothetical protein